MKESKTVADCRKKILPIRDALEIFRGKWKIPIIGTLLYYKELRFKDLQRVVGDITPKMLSKELKELEMNQLVTREVMDTRPISVLYKITPYGESCQEVITSLYEWGVNHRVKIIGER